MWNLLSVYFFSEDHETSYPLPSIKYTKVVSLFIGNLLKSYDSSIPSVLFVKSSNVDIIIYLIPF